MNRSIAIAALATVSSLALLPADGSAATPEPVVVHSPVATPKATSSAVATPASIPSLPAVQHGSKPQAVQGWVFNVPVHIAVPKEVRYLGKDKLFVQCDVKPTKWAGEGLGSATVPSLDANGAYDGTVTVKIGFIPDIAAANSYYCFMQNMNAKDPLNFEVFTFHLTTSGQLNSHDVTTDQLSVTDK